MKQKSRSVGCRLGVLAAALGSLGAGLAQAQTTLTPGAIMETVPKEAPQIPQPRRDAPVQVTPVEGARNLDPNAPRFAVSSFKITGNSAIDAAELQGVVAERVGKSYNLFELQKVADELTAYYRQRGYPVARAVLPAQKVEGGVVTIEIIEGRADSVTFEGNETYSESLLQRWAAPLIGKPVKLDAVEERMLAIDDLPGVTASAVLTQGALYGGTNLAVQVDDKPVEGQVSLNNYGRKEVGEGRIDANLALNNPLGIGDQIGVRTSYSDGGLLRLYGASYSLPLNIYGTRLALSYTTVDYRIGGDLRDLDLNGKSEIASATVLHPFLRSQRENLFGTVAVRSFSGRQYTDDLRLSDSDVTVLELGVAWNRIHDDFSYTAASMRVSSNFRDSDKGTRNDAHKFKIEGEATHLMPLATNWDLKLTGAGLWSPDALIDAERFSLGGPTSVRGYPAADVLGDRGIFGSVEARYRVSLGTAPGFISAFVDGGRTARKYAAAGTAEARNLASVGVGFTIQPSEHFNAQIMAAVPVTSTDPGDDRNYGRLWVSLNGAF